ncbi:MAG: HlyD family efflux transporter periplasmic adaptor subunit [Deltaproteobacteria bacterium]|nr:HlyD family efflux transporter periplasmic adaptor subunit [Deltaproteobacteria bacterium]
MTRHVARVMLALLVAGAACQAPPETEAPADAEPIVVPVVAVRRGDIDATLSASGETVALSALRLASPVAGRVTQLDAQPGDRLAAGSVAARVLPLENESVLHGFDVLAGAGALADGDTALARRLTREIRDHAVALRVPFAALVAARLHNPGEQVAQGEALLELFDPSSLVVVAQVPAAAAALVRPGMPVTVQGARQTGNGRVAAVLPGLTPQALTVPVRITLDTAPQPPQLGAAVACHIVTARHTAALLIPTRALVTSLVGDEGVVVVAVEGRAQRRRVQLGVRGADEVQVVTGLAAGDLVLTEAGVGLPDGAPITAQTPAPAPAGDA